MKRPRILVELLVRRRERAVRLANLRKEFRGYRSLSLRDRAEYRKRWESVPRVTVRSLLRLAAANRAFARSSWQSHDTEYYSACGWDDYQLERRLAAMHTAQGYRKAARFLHNRGVK